jgi:FMN phosphatase YigB (HAD superfamily)
MIVNKKAVIFDIDGTLANIDHRLHFIQKEPKDWDGFHSLCIADEPVEHICELARWYRFNQYQIILCTCRPIKNHNVTCKWLREHEIPFDDLYMRPDNDFRSDTFIKEEMIKYMHNNGDIDVKCIYEDRDRVVQMYRRLGYTCLQVKRGDY